MLIPHPLLGPRDAQEFVYLGDAALIERPEIAFPLTSEAKAIEQMHAYLYLRDNPAGEHRELWYHEQGDRSWLVVTRNTLTHDIVSVEMAVDVARAKGRGRGPDAPAADAKGSAPKAPAPMKQTSPDIPRESSPPVATEKGAAGMGGSGGSAGAGSPGGEGGGP